MTAAAFRMRWVAIAASGSLRGALKFGAAGEFLSVGSGSSSWKSAIGHAIRHCRQRLSAKPSFPLHNVVRHGGGRSITRCCGRLDEIKVAATSNSCRTGRLPLCFRPLTARISTLARKPNFARYLRDARIKRGLSVAEAADEVGVSTSSIYFWETDHVRPRDANLSALCKVLRLPIRATREMAAAG
jgi:DNA-binding XRE family transcriptional regulator